VAIQRDASKMLSVFQRTSDVTLMRDPESGTCRGVLISHCLIGRNMH
jgi:hypothetical protein